MDKNLSLNFISISIALVIIIFTSLNFFGINLKNLKKTNEKILSVIIGFSEEDAAEAAKTTVNLLHEIFNNFLVEGPYQNYMVEFFNEPEE